MNEVLQGIVNEVEVMESERGHPPQPGYSRRVTRRPIRMPVLEPMRVEEFEREGSEDSDSVIFLEIIPCPSPPSQGTQEDGDLSMSSYVQFPESSQGSSGESC